MVKALILEDDACSALALCALLEQAGVVAHSVPDTLEAIEEVRRTAPDVLLADLNVFGSASSIDVARELRRIRPDARVIFVSGFSRDEIEEQVAEIQPCSVYTKPMNFDALLDELDLRSSRAGSSLDRAPMQPHT